MATVEYLSDPAKVSMGDQWFEIVNLNHFWIQRRFNVFKKLSNDFLKTKALIGEIGCGNGLVQKQIEDEYNKNIDGFDLNIDALQNNVAEKSKVICYDILEKNKTLENKYEAMLLMDVLEHIDDEHTFLQATKFTIQKNGYLVINVPAFQSLYSPYDKTVGHIRRYDSSALINVVEANGFKCIGWTYWGLPLVPLLWVRKILMQRATEKEMIQKGMSPRFSLGNWGLKQLAKLEIIPQKKYGTSLMAVFQKQ